MSFEHAPVTKGLMVGCAITSVLVGLFDVKHYFHLQLSPHISRYHQYWRLGVHHLAFSNSSDLFVAELVLYKIGIQIERQFGSIKFASFALVSTLLATILEFISLLLFYRIGLNYISSGPSTLIFNILYQYSRIVPSVYQFRIFGLPLNNKSFIYVLALQLAISHLPGSAVAAAIGILSGQVYRSDLANLKSYRIPPSVVDFFKPLLLPFIGSIRPPRRSNRALPDDARTLPSLTNGSIVSQTQNDEIITTARTAAPSVTARGRTTDSNDGGTSVMREWVDELTGRTNRAHAGIRVPSDTEITQLTNMFPGISRDVVIGALQRSPNIEGAVETLLSSQT